MARVFVAIASLLGFLGVAAGAFGAHALRGWLAPDLLAVFDTAVRYQLIHAVALLAVAWASERWPGRAVAWAGASFVLGVLLFSGSLYVLCLTGMRGFGAVTPVGGVLLLIGWLALAVAALRGR